MPLPRGTELTVNMTGTSRKYRIEKMLGQGGFGIVYAASDSQGRKVAIKEYFPSTLATRIDGSTEVNPNTNDPVAEELFNSQKERFLQEAEHMRRFKDESSIVDVLDCFEANGTAYIVMEFIKGNTLAQVLGKVPNHRLPLERVIDDLKPIVDVLEKMHKENLIHRDISPYNIMFSATATKLLDFGAARIVAPGGKFTLTAIINRPYSPPEQFQEIDAEKLQGTWSDVYALAATIYHAITGKLAPHANQREYNSYHYNKDILQLPSALGIDITPQQENALLKGMALKIQDRYQTVREFFNAIKGEPPKVCPKCGHEYKGNECRNPYCPQIECPHCHRFYNSREPKCPYSDCPGKSTKIDKRPWLAAGCAILLAVASFGYTNSAKNHLTEVTQEVKELKAEAGKYDYISNNFGYGTSAYYADTPVLVLDKDGASGNIPVYWSNWGKDNTTEQDASISTNPSGLSVVWDDAVTNQRRNAILTSGSESGAYIVHFSNKKDNDSFDVLVVVK